MSDSKRIWKTFKGFFRKFDNFGETFTFRYKDEENHSSELGGIVCIIIYIMGFIYFIINLIHFINIKKRNFTLQYYSMNLNKTENISFLINKNSTAFAFGLTDDNNGDVSNLFNITFSYVDRQYINGIEYKDTKEIYYRPCNKNDFNETQNEKPFYGLKS